VCVSVCVSDVPGPNSIAKSVVEPDSTGRYTVYYTPVEVGLYTITVKWNGKEIEGTFLLQMFASNVSCQKYINFIAICAKFVFAYFMLFNLC